MRRRAIIYTVGLSAATMTFAIVNGISEYLTALSARTYVVVDGVQRDLTATELVFSFLVGDTMRAMPIGAVAVVLLSVPLYFVAQRICSLPARAGYFIGAIAGGFLGGVLSFVAFLMIGGWGPPLLLPAVVSGAVLALALVGACRRMYVAEQSHPRNSAVGSVLNGEPTPPPR